VPMQPAMKLLAWFVRLVDGAFMPLADGRYVVYPYGRLDHGYVVTREKRDVLVHGGATRLAFERRALACGDERLLAFTLAGFALLDAFSAWVVCAWPTMRATSIVGLLGSAALLVLRRWLAVRRLRRADAATS
jgi:hypothetical protein